MWQRFTERARRAVYAAKDAAKAHGAREVGPEHLLLGLLEEGTQACRLLEAVGIEPDRLRKEVTSKLAPGKAGPDAGETISRDLKNAIDLAYQEAREFGDNYIGTEHLILGLLKEERGQAAQALAHLGFEIENARLAVQAFRQGDASPVEKVPTESDEETPREDKEPDKGMWQRFTERARKVVFYAQEEAQKFGEGYVSTEHLLLGLVREPESVSSRVLEKLGVSLNRVRVEVEKHLPRGDARPSQDMTLTPRAKRVIDLSYDEARRLNNNYIGTEHLLLGLVREGDGLAGRVLARLGVDLERARREVMALQDAEAEGKGAAAPRRERSVDPAFTPLPWSAYEEDAQATLRRAHEHSNALTETHLTPLHLVLALLDEPDSPAAKALRKVGLGPERLRAAVERERTWAEGAPPEIQLSPNGRKVMDAASLEASLLNSERLNSAHILLGLYRGNADGVGRILLDLDVKINALRDAVQHLGQAGRQENEKDEEQDRSDG